MRLGFYPGYTSGIETSSPELQALPHSTPHTYPAVEITAGSWVSMSPSPEMGTSNMKGMRGETPIIYPLSS